MIHHNHDITLNIPKPPTTSSEGTLILLAPTLTTEPLKVKVEALGYIHLMGCMISFDNQE